MFKGLRRVRPHPQKNAPPVRQLKHSFSFQLRTKLAGWLLTHHGKLKANTDKSAKKRKT